MVLSAIPFGIFGKIFFAIRWICVGISKILFLPVYKESHARWARHHQLGSHWHSLGDYIEYSIRFAILADPEPRISRIAFRSPKKNIDKLEIVIEAYGAGVRHQDRVVLYHLNDTLIVSELPNMPVGMFLFNSSGGIHNTFESYKFIECRAYIDDEVINIGSSLRRYLTHSDILNDEWVEAWGVFWNGAAVKNAKQELKIYWKFGFMRPKIIVISSTKRKGCFLYDLVFPIRAIMSSNWSVTVQFWLLIWSGLFVLGDNDKLRFRFSFA